jgi:hypothetical protein
MRAFATPSYRPKADTLDTPSVARVCAEADEVGVVPSGAQDPCDSTTW